MQPQRVDAPDVPSVPVGLPPDVYPFALAPSVKAPQLLGREVVVQGRGVVAILGGLPEPAGRDPSKAYRTTNIDTFPRSFVLGRQVAYVSDATTPDEPLTPTLGSTAALREVRVDLSGWVVEVEHEEVDQTVDPSVPVVLGLFYGEEVDYVSEHSTGVGPVFAVRVGGVAGPPGRLTAVETSGVVELEAHVLPSARVVVWSLGPEPTLVWASKRSEGFDAMGLFETRPNDYTCEGCGKPGRFSLRRTVRLADVGSLEVTYLAWDAPEVPPELSRAAWDDYRAGLDTMHARTEQVQVVSG